ncbi:MAG: hypothetical protein Q4E64_09310 [Phascolarctobacterium sp.]|nr:hypothetical protein [Phascolarctobacterium sp.]
MKQDTSHEAYKIVDNAKLGNVGERAIEVVVNDSSSNKCEGIKENTANIDTKHVLTDCDSSNNAKDKVGGLSTSTFDHLNEDQKGEVLSSHNSIQQKEKDSGWIGKVIGANIKNAAFNTAFLICLFALVICGIDLIFGYVCRRGNINAEIWKILIPIVSVALGYIFGKSK